MFRRFSFIIYLAIAFLALSGVVYFVHYLIFRDVHQLIGRVIIRDLKKHLYCDTKKRSTVV